MSDSYDEVAQQLLQEIADNGVASEGTTTALKNLKTFAEAKKLLEPEPQPEPEPKGFKAFCSRHASELIKVGGTLSVVSIIAVLEAKGDLIFRSKATKYL